MHSCSIWHQDKHLFAGCLHFFTYFVLAFLKNMFTFAVVLDNKGKLSVILSYKLFIMKRFLLLCFTLAIATAISIAQESEPQLGITSRTNCSNFWRYNFNYETTDIDDVGIVNEKIQLDGDEYFVLGDNRKSSEDSRNADIGNVKREYIYGKAWFVLSPKKDFGFIR